MLETFWALRNAIKGTREKERESKYYIALDGISARRTKWNELWNNRGGVSSRYEFEWLRDTTGELGLSH